MPHATPESVIRDARAEDAIVLAAAEREIAKIPGRLASRPHELKDEAFLAKVDALARSESGIYVVLESNGNIVGHALLDPLRLEVTAHVVVLTIAIHEGQQGKGFGKLLLSHLIDWARSNAGIEKVMLHVRSSNEVAIGLYKKAGFSLDGVSARQIKLGPNTNLDNIAMSMWVGP
jgi:ribosomal protein S18 acetylase RimI-like enzyme